MAMFVVFPTNVAALDGKLNWKLAVVFLPLCNVMELEEAETDPWFDWALKLNVWVDPWL